MRYSLPQTRVSEQSQSILDLYVRLSDQIAKLIDKSETKFYSWMTCRSNRQTYKQCLSASSILRGAVERLHGYNKPDTALSHTQLKVLMEILHSGAERKQLPPLHWSSLLTPVMRCQSDTGDDLRRLCLMTAIHQSKSCTVSAALVSKWCSPQLFKTLSSDTQADILSVTHKYINHIGTERLVTFRDAIWIDFVSQDDDDDDGNSMKCLSSLLDSFLVVLESFATQTPSTQTFIYESILRLYQALSPTSQNYLKQLDLLSRCLTRSEATLTEQVYTSVTDERTQLLICCSLLENGCSLDKLIPLMELVAANCDREWLLKTVYPCWKSLNSNIAMEFLTKMQAVIKNSNDEPYQTLLMELLTTAMISWSEGRPTFAHLKHIFLYYCTNLHTIKPWSQLEQQTKRWLHDVTQKGMLSRWDLSTK